LKIAFPQIQIGNFQLEESLSLIENCLSSNTNFIFPLAKVPSNEHPEILLHGKCAKIGSFFKK